MSCKKILLVLVLLAGGALLARVLPAVFSSAPEHGSAPGVLETGERKVLYWYDPMVPGTHFDQPGQSPFMDMLLVPRYADEGEGQGVFIDPAQVWNTAVRTEKAVWGRLSFSRDIPGNVVFNDYQLARVQPRADGFVERISPLAVGDVVVPGAPLAEITVPGWASDQSEYLLLKSQRAEARLVRGVRERLRLSGMPEEMLDAVEATGRVQTRLTIQAPLGGVITSLDVYPGMNVDKGMTIATIQGVNPIWVTAEVPERDVHLAASAGRIRVSLPAWPDRVFYSDSFVLLPKANQDTRTVPLRLTLDNAEGLLRPGLTAVIRLRSEGEEALLIPTQSLIDLGDEQRVITRTPEGAFVPKTVQVLRSSRDRTAIAAGLEEGEEVVVTGLFLIDSEANLRGALDRMRRDNNLRDAASSGKEAE
jgi:Cu(I)/Ag(I) efflux system membrane fusion protein